MRKRIKFASLELELTVNRKKRKKIKSNIEFDALDDIKLIFGPGPNWKKPDDEWYSVDIDPSWGDIVVNFQDFEGLPLKSSSVQCVYGSHVFEHMSIFKTPLIFSEIFRVLKKGGILRLILPDAEKSLREYVNGNHDFQLFQKRRERAKKLHDRDYTIFECLKEDFLSASGQESLLGKNSLAHQNAWDYETIHADLVLAGFSAEKIFKMDFQKSHRDSFSFEGTFPAEANEDYRSLYVESIK